MTVTQDRDTVVITLTEQELNELQEKRRVRSFFNDGSTKFIPTLDVTVEVV